ncbi:SEC-C metal-binding domain-containing protein [Virgibacillus sp. W0430]|uniref:SEC-C metal-binding domain-containing protein n=1 Tax=Virgibacillus sp. W0430 TaxID=3391580 RepID=UPI003F453586
MSNFVLSDDLQEELDKLMQEGYTESMKNHSTNASDKWLKLWERIKEIMAHYEIPYIEMMDKAFHGLQSIYNWSNDFEMELHNASATRKSYLQTRIDFCRDYIAMSESKDEYNNLLKRRMIAESYTMLGNFKEGERLYKDFVHQYPEDGWGWINWSDQYDLFAHDEYQDYKKAVHILETGLDISDLKDREDVLDRLEELYTKLDMSEKADAARREIEMIKRDKERKSYKSIQELKKIMKELPKDTSVKRQKIGRNDTCPCGSGKKYKKCCGK